MNQRFAVLLFALALPVFGQVPNGQQLRARLIEARVSLNLTPEQTEKIVPVLLEEFRALLEVRDSGDGPRQKLRAAGEIRSKADGQLKDLLDEEQVKEMAKLREQCRTQGRKQR